MTKVLKSHVGGRWFEGGNRSPLVDPTTEEILAEAGTGGLDFKAAVDHARNVGGPALYAMTFAQRGDMLASMASAIHELRDEIIELALKNGGNTRGDAKFDFDGCTGTLQHYAELGRSLGSATMFTDGDPIRLARSPRYVGRHVLTSLSGVAVHINAFNFPAWGFGEKAAVALLAGLPVITKPATSTALVAERIIEKLVEKKVLPEGALTFICGSVGDLLDHLGSQDVLAFTGSAETGAKLRGRADLVRKSVRVNIEADSLNAAILGADVEPVTDTWDLFIRDVARDMTQKAGQKCTAIRRIVVPKERVDDVRRDLAEALSAVRVGDPRQKDVRMGPVATKQQLDDVRAGIAKLRTQAELVHGDGGRGTLLGDVGERGFFVAPTLLLASKPHEASAVHEHEVFGPCATLMPHDGACDAIGLVRRGEGSLVASIYSDDKDFAQQMLMGLSAFHGRLNFGSAKVAEHSIGPGAVLPSLVHGGPGRAGGGEELGSLRGLDLYLQRTALQGDEPMLAKMLEGAARVSSPQDSSST